MQHPEGFVANLTHSIVSGRALALIVTLAATLVACASPGTQGSPKTARIGYVDNGWPGPTTALVGGFLGGLHERGWVQGENTSVEFRFAEGNEDRLPALIQELLDLRVDVIVTGSTQATRAAKNATSTTPVVFMGLADPAGAGVIDNTARPGGNLTGTSLMTAHLHGKHLQLLKETVPALARVAVLANPTSAGTSIPPLQDAGQTLGVEILIFYTTSAEEFKPALDEAVLQGAEALIAVPDRVVLCPSAVPD